jgi:hypothetical protein
VSRETKGKANMTSISMEVKFMRKVALSFLLLCSAIALGQEPQWTVVKHVVLFNQNQPIPQTTLLTPTEANIYRLTLYFSGGGTRVSPYEAFLLNVSGTDISGQSWSPTLILACNDLSVGGLPPYMVISKPNLPLTYQVDSRLIVPSADCTYNVTITVEQLVQQ